MLPVGVAEVNVIDRREVPAAEVASPIFKNVLIAPIDFREVGEMVLQTLNL